MYWQRSVLVDGIVVVVNECRDVFRCPPLPPLCRHIPVFIICPHIIWHVVKQPTNHSVSKKFLLTVGGAPELAATVAISQCVGLHTQKDTGLQVSSIMQQFRNLTQRKEEI